MPVDTSTTAEELITLLRKDSRTRGEILTQPRVGDALQVAKDLYQDIDHWSGIPLLVHCLKTLRVLLPLSPDEDTVIACLLHHAVETHRVTLLDIEERFGPDVRSMVGSLHLLHQLLDRRGAFSAEALRLMIIRLSDDHRSLLIFLSSRVAAMDAIGALPVRERRATAREALRVLAPIAALLGVYAIKHEIERQAFPMAYPDDAERIASQLTGVHAQYGSFLAQAGTVLAEMLETHNVPCTVEMREKQPFSIFTKMNNKGLSQLTAVHDLFAFRVIVQKEEDCYLALGLLHRIAHPVPNRFKDYISFPKPNGYRSLHTTLTGLPNVPPGVFCEVQIRTEEMHREAEYGIAAHWNYKQGGSATQALQRFELLKAAERQEEGEGRTFVDHIFVLTPRGDVIELPEGATPLDFAFQVHTDIGLAFRAARVNGVIVPLSYTLENGDMVEVLRSNNPRPSPRWLKLLRTASARSRLKRYFEKLQTTDATPPIAKVPPPPAPPRRRAARPPRASPPTSWKFRVIGEGTDLRMPLQPAKCCSPDRDATHGAFTGVVARDGVLRVHRANCKLLRQVNPERTVRVVWAETKRQARS